MNLFELLFLGFVFCLVSMFLAWWRSTRIQYYSLVDVVWTFGIGILSVLFSILGGGSASKRIMAVSMGLIWSARLGLYLTLRLKSHFPKEDTRYIELKSKWKNKEFFLFFQFQGLSQVLFSLPFLFLCLDPISEFSTSNYIGVILFVLGFAGESLADYQLNSFRSLAANKGKVCDVGLWKYSRHPNYFFEWLIWCGIGASALSAPYGVVGLLSPILMYLTLNFVTGVPAAEVQSLKSRGEAYVKYQQRTSRFFLWLPK